jgi:hypothetical protein
MSARERVSINAGKRVFMRACKRVSLWSACRQLDGYPQLILNLAGRTGIVIEKVGQSQYLNSEDVERLRPLVKEWRERPRMSRPSGP